MKWRCLGGIYDSYLLGSNKYDVGEEKSFLDFLLTSYNSWDSVLLRVAIFWRVLNNTTGNGER